MRLAACAEVLAGRLVGEDATFVGGATDSRDLCPGSLFFALSGPSFDGHDFVDRAFAAGAAGAVVARAASTPSVLVADPRRALGQLAAHWRSEFRIPLVAVTGSNGKTTTKEMVASILRRAGSAEETLVSRGNFNNDIGVPLTLFRLAAGHRTGVLELGANHPGEIAALARMVRPRVGIITQCAPAHLEGFGSIDAVARAKGELFEQLPGHGTAVINADDPYRDLWTKRASHCRSVTFGLDGDADVSASFEHREGGARVELRLPDGSAPVNLPYPGRHNVMNALAAAAACFALGISRETIAAGLESAPPVAGRLARTTLASGARLIDDSYNANPTSLAAALEVISREPGRRWLVLGDMAELGDDAERYHAEAGVAAHEAGVERLYTLGRLSARAADAFAGSAFRFEDAAALGEALRAAVEPGVTILIKGSRAMQMERIVDLLREGGV